jgi:DEAD/DEAH box helicase domain-containing protein
MDGFDPESFVSLIAGGRRGAGRTVTVRRLPPRPPAFADPVRPIPPPIRAALSTRGVQGLFTHQADAVDRIRAGEDVVVVTGTASGKSLCYLLPILEAIGEDPLATALALYPTKALAQDQLRGIEELRAAGGLDFLAGAYDGDTPPELRRRLRDSANLILTNPDMLHAGILPNHARFARFLSHLRYVVLDEVHAYRGVFGSHVANVIRRLRRLCAHHGAAPVFVASSATIANPAEHASRVTGTEMVPVTADGSPRGPRTLVVLNPPPLAPSEGGAAGGDRRSALSEAIDLFTTLVREGVQTIAFTRTRLMAELLHRGARDRLSGISRRLAERVCAYRGGYLPEERRAIERGLASREILGVASTNALELGIDIGSLDAAILLGYPGTVASFWQQAGRAGRGLDSSLVILISRNTPVDQFIAADPEWLFARGPERAVTDPDNPHVTVGHLRCAAHEMPLPLARAGEFGPFAPAVLEAVEEEGRVRRIDDVFYYTDTRYPAADVSLRNIAGPVFTIEDVEAGRVIGTMDELSALTQLHDHAVYLHGGETWFVRGLDLDQRIARVVRRELDFFTQAVRADAIRVDTREEERPVMGGTLSFGEVTVTTSIPMYKKVRFASRESVGYEDLALPPIRLETVSLWFVPSPEVTADLAAEGLLASEALAGLANLLVELTPVFLLCDPDDVGASVDASQTGRDALFLFDRFPGGMGYARAALDRFPALLEAARTVIEGCGCVAGCPSCVGARETPAAASLDLSAPGRIPDKLAAAALLGLLAGRSELPSRSGPTMAQPLACLDPPGDTASGMPGRAARRRG